MKRPPRPTKEPVINWEMQIGTLVQAVVMTAGFSSLTIGPRTSDPQEVGHAQTIAFVTLCMSELFRAFTARSERHGLFSIGVFTNRWMVWAVSGSALLVFLAVYVPFLQPFFDTTSLSMRDWIMAIPFIFMASIACGDHEGLYPEESSENGLSHCLKAGAGGMKLFSNPSLLAFPRGTGAFTYCR